jgi:hypothetical protein
MATLTYDPTEPQEGEFNEEELDALAVGEQLAQEEANLLAGKFRDADELEQAYLELQKKLGSRDEEPEQVEEVEEEVEEEEYSPAANLIQEASAEYYNNNGQLSEETIAKFSEMSSQDLVQAYIQLQANQPQQEQAEVVDLSDREVNFIQNSVGGEQAYAQMVQAIQLAVAGLRSEYERSVGYEGQMYTGKAARQQVDAFRSQAEVVRAMSDPRYENDPAYRQDIFDKLERSNIQY